MKKLLISKIAAAAAALLMALALTGCGAKAPADDTADEGTVTPVTSAADVSGSDVSGSDVSGSDVVDDAAEADRVFNEYFAALNAGDAGKLVELTAAPPMMSLLETIGAGEDYLLSSYQATIDGMKAVSGGYRIAYDYTAADAEGDQLGAVIAEVEGMSKGAGEKVQAARLYTVNMKAYAAQMPVSASDVVSGADAVSAGDIPADAQVLEESESVFVLYKYGGSWYVLGA